jgi:hypothetical protein
MPLLGLEGEDPDLAPATVPGHGGRDTDPLEAGRVDLNAVPVGEKEHRLQPDHVADGGGEAVDDEPVTGGDAVLVTAMTDDDEGRRGRGLSAGDVG